MLFLHLQFIRYFLWTRLSCVKVTCKNWSISRHLLRYTVQSCEIALQSRRQKYHSCGLSTSDIVRTKLNFSICYIHTAWYALAFHYTFCTKICLANTFWHKIFLDTFLVRDKISAFEHISNMCFKLPRIHDEYDFILLRIALPMKNYCFMLQNVRRQHHLAMARVLKLQLLLSKPPLISSWQQRWVN